MNLYDVQQQGAQFNPFQANNPQIGQGYGPWGGLGLSAAYGQGYGHFGHGQQFAQPMGWGQQRQLSQQDVGDVVRQLVPLLPQILTQSQIAPAAFGNNYGQQSQFGQPFAQFGRQLTQQDVHEVVRQILPIVPQIVGALQGPQAAAIYGGHQPGQGWQQQTWWPQQQAWQQPQGMPQYLAAFQSGWGLQSQRQLSQQDVNEVARQLIGVIPQVIGNLQSFSQQRAM